MPTEIEGKFRKSSKSTKIRSRLKEFLHNLQSIKHRRTLKALSSSDITTSSNTSNTCDATWGGGHHFVYRMRKTTGAPQSQLPLDDTNWTDGDQSSERKKIKNICIYSKNVNKTDLNKCVSRVSVANPCFSWFRILSEKFREESPLPASSTFVVRLGFRMNVLVDRGNGVGITHGRRELLLNWPADWDDTVAGESSLDIPASTIILLDPCDIYFYFLGHEWNYTLENLLVVPHYFVHISH